MSNVYTKAWTQIYELEARCVNYLAAGATEERGEELHGMMRELMDKVRNGDMSIEESLLVDYCDDPSYKLVQAQRSLKGLRETVELPLAQTGRCRYLITDGDLVSPAGYYDDGVYIKNDVWIETDRLPRHVEGLVVYDMEKVNGRHKAA